MDFVTSRSGVIRSVSQRWLYKQWALLRSRSPVPCWKDLPMDEIGTQVDTLIFCDVVDAGGTPRFLVRFLGRRLKEAYGGDRTGEFLDEVLPPRWRDGAMQTYNKALEGRPVYNIVETGDRDGGKVMLERMILPFTSGNGGVDRIVASVESFAAAGKFTQDGLAASPNLGANCLINGVIEDPAIDTLHLTGDESGLSESLGG